MSTLCSLVLPEASLTEGREVLQPKTRDCSEKEEIPFNSSNTKVLSESSENAPSSSQTAQIGDVLIQPSNNVASHTILSTLSSCGVSPLDGTPPDNYALLQGQILSKSVKANHLSPLYSAGPFEVQIEYSMGPSRTTPSSQPRNLSYSIEWLTIDKAMRVLEQYASSVYNAESLEGEISHNMDDQNCFYITARGSALKILLQPRIPD